MPADVGVDFKARAIELRQSARDLRREAKTLWHSARRLRLRADEYLIEADRMDRIRENLKCHISEWGAKAVPEEKADAR